MDAKIYHVFAAVCEAKLGKDYFVGEFFTARKALSLAEQYFDAGYSSFVCNVRSGAIYLPHEGRIEESYDEEELNNYFYS